VRHNVKIWLGEKKEIEDRKKDERGAKPDYLGGESAGLEGGRERPKKPLKKKKRVIQTRRQSKKRIVMGKKAEWSLAWRGVERKVVELLGGGVITNR